jgi:predicted DNA-binding transcriptional regulator AlpA
MCPPSLIPSDAPLIVNAPTLARWLRVWPSVISFWIAVGRMPKPVRAGKGCFVWPTEEIRRWLASKDNPVARRRARHARRDSA